MDRIYISGPMTGYPDFNVHAFRDAARNLRGEGWQVISPHELDEAEGVELEGKTGHEYDDNMWSEAMDRDLELVASAGLTAMALLPGWEKSGGVGREGRIAIEHEIPLYIYEPRLPNKLVYLSDADFLRLSTTTRVTTTRA